MFEQSYIDKIQKMPPDYQQEVRDFIDFVWENKLNMEPSQVERKTLFGAFKGKSWMSPDFDEPLDDFKEYM
jgi:hypothetical protein